MFQVPGALFVYDVHYGNENGVAPIEIHALKDGTEVLGLINHWEGSDNCPGVGRMSVFTPFSQKPLRSWL